MMLPIYYIFLPTPDLIEAAELANQKTLLDVGVWIDKLHDRTGLDHPQAQVEAAFWTIFLANLFEDTPESGEIVRMRETCLNLGFSGCWHVLKTTVGGEVTELLEEFPGADSFIRNHGVSLH